MKGAKRPSLNLTTCVVTKYEEDHKTINRESRLWRET